MRDLDKQEEWELKRAKAKVAGLLIKEVIAYEAEGSSSSTTYTYDGKKYKVTFQVTEKEQTNGK